jgi:hypothetical protein
MIGTPKDNPVWSAPAIVYKGPILPDTSPAGAPFGVANYVKLFTDGTKDYVGGDVIETNPGPASGVGNLSKSFYYAVSNAPLESGGILGPVVKLWANISTDCPYGNSVAGGAAGNTSAWFSGNAFGGFAFSFSHSITALAENTGEQHWTFPKIAAPPLNAAETEAPALTTAAHQTDITPPVSNPSPGCNLAVPVYTDER